MGGGCRAEGSWRGQTLAGEGGQCTGPLSSCPSASHREPCPCGHSASSRLRCLPCPWEALLGGSGDSRGWLPLVPSRLACLWVSGLQAGPGSSKLPSMSGERAPMGVAPPSCRRQGGRVSGSRLCLQPPLLALCPSLISPSSSSPCLTLGPGSLWPRDVRRWPGQTGQGRAATSSGHPPAMAKRPRFDACACGTMSGARVVFL